MTHDNDRRDIPSILAFLITFSLLLTRPIHFTSKELLFIWRHDASLSHFPPIPETRSEFFFFFGIEHAVNYFLATL